jgi:nitroimidazol reductase NimA-like FMN-containing flavoprotein (pyridoxamine 5'-phosphate oxidase superfamily)
MGIRLTEDEAWDVIERSHTGILTTLKADGWPVTLPVWFVVLDRTICLRTPSRTRKVARVRRDPRASFLVESGERWAELCAVHLSGTLQEVDEGDEGDEATRARIDAALDQKYAGFRTPRSAMPKGARDHYTDWAYLRLVPADRILTWDNSRIELRADG